MGQILDWYEKNWHVLDRPRGNLEAYPFTNHELIEMYTPSMVLTRNVKWVTLDDTGDRHRSTFVD